MTKLFFGIDDYQVLDSETQKLVDEWVSKHELADKAITMIQKVGDDVIAAGPQLDENHMMVDNEIIIKAQFKDDFPWEVVMKKIDEGTQARLAEIDQKLEAQKS